MWIDRPGSSWRLSGSVYILRIQVCLAKLHYLLLHLISGENKYIWVPQQKYNLQKYLQNRDVKGVGFQ